ncbi:MULTISPECIES: DNA mismatch repair endonuclease MutL [Chryseobacterium]|uniref:DNA mismatch repair endonuclease MutL n=1 Tax=Chryseobacterium TaxID=59732 RepID=UPI000E721B5A|nr:MULTISPECIES: DNA mismatch repair endonuclease MutL [Chryseobacterium]MDH5034617.1 DNA mismatch repair endonuclease MutL [Chryseobacterium cucumeris]QWT84907.1 DNA mismatch repair endonuclease MutL [Chryseobacterium sp. PCH239]RKE78433.1 DNA mismatch repair protein MutL [Chryseobacterium sp. AG363]TXI97314.1 MAG: DNA mismatch repair endonuclease MutL [Chryseobacterium cucumeris]
MSDIIQLLPDHVANQIAAGEVVQRPASIVKELLENAIDADATKIELIIRDAGKNLIQVVDDGKGMSETDARMAFERHATSKIKGTEDIFKIATKGFRGEALASIAAVSQVELRTKQKDTSIGTNIYIEGGVFQFQDPVQTADGSNFLVKNLFYNVPARRKFLKNNNIEFRHVIDEFQRVALAHENLEFSLFHDDEAVFRLRKGSQMQRIVDVFGRKLQPLLIPIKEDIIWCKLHGFVAKPEGAKKARGEQFLFVNGRYFRSPYFNKAVQEAFEGLLQPGYVPSFFLFLELDPEKIDVNIHPQKTEVKFEDEHLIFALLRSTIKRSLGIYNVSPSLDFDRDPELDEMMNKPIPSKGNGGGSGGGVFKMPEIIVDKDYNPFLEEKNVVHPEEIQNLTEMYHQNITAEPSKINLFEDEDFDEDLMRLPNGYWLFNKGDVTLMLDLGRMHRLLVSEGNKSTRKSNTNSHALLFSLEYHMNEIEKTKYNSIKKYLPELGFDMKIAHESVLRIDSLPEGLKETQAMKFLENLFEILDYKTEEEFLQYYHNQWNKMQSKSRFDFIYKKDAEQLIKDFTALGFPEFLPDGKRCFYEVPFNDFKNKF